MFSIYKHMIQDGIRVITQKFSGLKRLNVLCPYTELIIIEIPKRQLKTM